MWQRTLKQSLRFSGVGLHSGEEVAIRVLPAPVHSGLVFRPNGQRRISAVIANVDANSSHLCTQVEDGNGPNVSTVEHLMAALVAARISNAFIDFEGNDKKLELPVLDGSSVEFVREIQRVGVREQLDAKLKYLRIKRPVQVYKHDKAAWLLPIPEELELLSAPTLHMSVQVNFEHKRLGSSFCRFALRGSDPDATLDDFDHQLAAARTFTFADELKWLRANGFAKGGSLDNAVVFADDGQALNENGLRYSDEWVRHKMLDCIGDIGLAGLPLHGYFFATSPGHSLTHELLRELFTDTDNFEEM